MGRVFFFLDLPCSLCVLNMFSSCSLEVPQVPKLFPNAFSVTPQFYPVWLKGRLLGEFICFYFAIGALNSIMNLNTLMWEH